MVHLYIAVPAMVVMWWIGFISGRDMERSKQKHKRYGG